jgi:glycosyltransferase involved in cell wall biosynthesis
MGLENLITAIREVVKVTPDIYLVLGGDGPLKDDLADLTRQLGVEDFIRFVGFIPEGELPAYYRMADVFVLPTLELEGFGLVTLEALASGVPALGTPVGGTVEILKVLNPRLLFKDKSPESIARLILETYREFREDPASQGKLSIQCRRFVEQNYSWEKNLDKLENLFRCSP